MATQDFTTTLLVNATPAAAFTAITNMRGWWSEQIDGDTENLNGLFEYHYKDVHYCKMQLVERVENEKLVWLVLDNYFKFTKDKQEWIGTHLIFELAPKGKQTQIRFTHQGLVPAYECFDICQKAWSNYANNSLHSLIETGKGQPNTREDDGFNAQLVEEWRQQEQPKATTALRISFVTDKTAQVAFDAINNVRGWWTENLTGNTTQLHDVFEVQFADIHYSKQELVQVIPNVKVVWLVTNSRLSFLSNPAEWTGTRVCFDIIPKDGKTEVTFTHEGLVPAIECYDACSGAWGGYINGSLRKLVETGTGEPTTKE